MENKVLRKLFLGFIHIHILHHAVEDKIYGAWMMEELREHGYDISPGTLYPILNSMEREGLLSMNKEVVGGKVIKYYRTTKHGEVILEEAVNKARILFHEVSEDKND